MKKIPPSVLKVAVKVGVIYSEHRENGEDEEFKQIVHYTHVMHHLICCFCS